MGPIPEFNRTELHVLQILWDAGNPLKPGEIEERFQWHIENATLRSILRVMVERGELHREKQGKAYFYSPGRPKRNALAELTDGLAEIFSSGSKAGLIAQLLQDESLSPEDVRQLTAIANGKETESSRKTRKRKT